MMKNQRRFLPLIAALLVGGCGAASTNQPLTEDQKQDAILADPMNYKPNMNRTVTGDDGDMTHLGKGLNNDVDDVLNP